MRRSGAFPRSGRSRQDESPPTARSILQWDVFSQDTRYESSRRTPIRYATGTARTETESAPMPIHHSEDSVTDRPNGRTDERTAAMSSRQTSSARTPTEDVASTAKMENIAKAILLVTPFRDPGAFDGRESGKQGPFPAASTDPTETGTTTIFFARSN